MKAKLLAATKGKDPDMNVEEPTSTSGQITSVDDRVTQLQSENEELAEFKIRQLGEIRYVIVLSCRSIS